MSTTEFTEIALQQPEVKAMQAGSGLSKETFSEHVKEVLTHSWWAPMLAHAGKQLWTAIMPLLIALITRKLTGSQPA